MELLHRPGVKQGEMAATLGLSKSAMSRLVDQLQRRGWVERLDDANDGRVRRPNLTSKGLRLAHRIDQASIERFSVMLGGVPEELRGQVVHSLELLHRSVKTNLPGNKEDAR